jgi:hypothetical protein
MVIPFVGLIETHSRKNALNLKIFIIFSFLIENEKLIASLISSLIVPLLKRINLILLMMSSCLHEKVGDCEGILLYHFQSFSKRDAALALCVRLLIVVYVYHVSPINVLQHYTGKSAW